MAYSVEVLSRASARLAGLRADHESKANARRAQVYETLPRIQEIDKQLQRNMVQAAFAAFSEGAQDAMAKAKAANRALEKEREEEHIFDLAGGGFESTVRLAKSSADTWIPILLENKYNVLDVLREHIHQLQIMRRMIERDDSEGLREAMNKANSIKRILK